MEQRRLAGFLHFFISSGHTFWIMRNPGADIPDPGQIQAGIESDKNKSIIPSWNSFGYLLAA
jgi:hypothetical protein